ncbi:hypothetical protein BX600DRAFT_475933 [Xylariales sp. PMI_506]|nr:hypothetical protein BX600DRAFT_475933 [Xylariales sp. PMI_506]
MPVINSELIQRGLLEVRVIVPRSVDHTVLEALAVIATCIFGVGGFMYWAMKQK